MNSVAAVNVEARQKILCLEEAIRNSVASSELPEDECLLKHHFAPGLYAREIFIPAGTAVVGKIHKHAHINNISHGRVRVFTEFGSDVFEAPFQFVSLPGTKRAVYAETDVIWTTYHPTEETDLEKIEEHVIAKSFDDFDRLTYIDIKGLIS